MNQSSKPGAAKPPRGRDEPFGRADDAIWLADAATLALKEKTAAMAAPTIRPKAETGLPPERKRPVEPPRGAQDKAYGPTAIVTKASEDDSPEEKAPAKRRGLIGLFRGKRSRGTAATGDVAAIAVPSPVRRSRRAKYDRSDFVVGALGLTLGLTCALFPWYIFFNQEKFGVREFVFSGGRGGPPPTDLAYQPSRVGQPFASGELPRMDLDFFPTATLPGQGEPTGAVPVADQPFPADLVAYRLIHVANGRAMIQDDDGLWVVQPGSQLPDASRVASIEKRDGRWVVVTSLDRVVEMER